MISKIARLLIITVVLHGGVVDTKAVSLWQLTQIKYTYLLETYPLTYCPYKAYLAVDKYVKVYDGNNQNHIASDVSLYAECITDAKYNKAHAKKYKGTPRQRVRKIYRYCYRTKYVAHVKTARDVFEKRQGDCAGIASAFYVMCKKNKIPVRYVIGWSRHYCHAWNRVKLDGKWYWIDATLGYYLMRDLPKGWSVMEIW